MRLPVRSETDALRIALVGALVIGVAVLLGYLTDPGWGIAFFIVAALAGLFWDVLRPDPGAAPLREAEQRGPGRAARRVLVVADEALGGQALRERLLALGEPRPELRIVAPVLLSRGHYVVSDSDRERADASRRLDQALAWARAEGFTAFGVVGDANDPLAAIEDELRRFGGQEVIVASHPPERRGWVEKGILRHLTRELEMPVEEVVVEADAGRAPA